MDTPKRILERRRSVRISESFLFKIGHKGYDIQAISVNLSGTGVLGLVERDIPLMSQLAVVLELPPQSPKTAGKPKVVRAKGVLVRKEKDGRTGRFLVAIYFSSIGSADRRRLETFIDRYLKTP